MASSNGFNFSKNLNRTKQKILQSVGKSDRSSDEMFERHEINFELQSKNAKRLALDLKRYIESLREAQKFGQAFHTSLRKVYEPNWSDNLLFNDHIQSIDLCWSDYLKRLNNDVGIQLNGYLAEFPQVKKSLEKRSNRLLDYDATRERYQHLHEKSKLNDSISTKSSNKLSPSKHAELLTKLTKVKIELDDKQLAYEDVNQSVCMSMAQLHDDRVKFYSNLMQTYFNSEHMFHRELFEIDSRLDNVCKNITVLETDNDTLQETASISGYDNRPSMRSPPDYNYHLKQRATLSNRTAQQAAPLSSSITKKTYTLTASQASKFSEADKQSGNNGIVFPTNQKTTTGDLNNSAYLKATSESSRIAYVDDSSASSTLTSNDTKKGISDFLEPKGYLYKVEATHNYLAKESDELTFVKGDLIQVVEGTDLETEDLDEGWAVGIHLLSNKRGHFPLNFIKKL